MGKVKKSTARVCVQFFHALQGEKNELNEIGGKIFEKTPISCSCEAFFVLFLSMELLHNRLLPALTEQPQEPLLTGQPQEVQIKRKPNISNNLEHIEGKRFEKLQGSYFSLGCVFFTLTNSSCNATRSLSLFLQLASVSLIIA